MATRNNPLKDFDAAGLVKASQSHEEQLKDLSDRVAKLEDRIIGNEAFAQSFISAQSQDKNIDETIKKIIGEYDRHLLIVKGTSLIKWAGAVIIGGILGALITGYFNRS